MNPFSLARCDVAEFETASCAIALPAGDPPDWVELLPLGTIEARDGRKWTMRDAAPVLAATAAYRGSHDILIDYDHAAEDDDKAAPAAGWISDLEVRDGAIYGRTTWTERAIAAIKAREYRYISPVFGYDKRNRVTMLARAGLTNIPALDLKALARIQTSHNADDEMNDKQLKALKAACGITDDMSDDDMSAAMQKVKKAMTAYKGMDDKAKASSLTVDEFIAKASIETGGEPDASKWVSKEQFDLVSTQLKALQDDNIASKATAAVDAAVRAGKIAPAQRDWAMGYCKTDAAAFATFVEGAPVIVAAGERGDTSGAPDPNADLTADELAVCRNMGMTPEAYKASKVQIAAG